MIGCLLFDEAEQNKPTMDAREQPQEEERLHETTPPKRNISASQPWSSNEGRKVRHAPTVRWGASHATPLQQSRKLHDPSAAQRGAKNRSLATQN